MRGVIGRRLSNPNGFTFSSILMQSPFLIQPTSHFSSSSSDGSGRGRGRGFAGGDGNGQFGNNRNESVNQGRDSSESQSPGGYGHGRGRPIQSTPISPPFSSFVKSDSPSIGRGRGSVGSEPVPPFVAQKPISPNVESQSQTQTQPPKTFTQLQDMKEATSSPSSPPPETKSGEAAPPDNIFNALGSEFSNSDLGNGAGRGKPLVESSPPRNEGENRHIRRPQPPPPPQSQQKRAQPPKDVAPKPKLSAEEAGRRARSELSRGEAVEASGVRGGRGGGRGGRGRGGRGVRGRGRGGRGGEGYGNDKKEEEAEKEALNTFVGDSADGERFAHKMGPGLMKELADGFEEICEKALPSTTHDAIVDAYDLNMMVKFLSFL